MPTTDSASPIIQAIIEEIIQENDRTIDRFLHQLSSTPSHNPRTPSPTNLQAAKAALSDILLPTGRAVTISLNQDFGHDTPGHVCKNAMSAGDAAVQAALIAFFTAATLFNPEPDPEAARKARTRLGRTALFASLATAANTWGETVQILSEELGPLLGESQARELFPLLNLAKDQAIAVTQAAQETLKAHD